MGGVWECVLNQLLKEKELCNSQHSAGGCYNQEGCFLTMTRCHYSPSGRKNSALGESLATKQKVCCYSPKTMLQITRNAQGRAENVNYSSQKYNFYSLQAKANIVNESFGSKFLLNLTIATRKTKNNQQLMCGSSVCEKSCCSLDGWGRLLGPTGGGGEWVNEQPRPSSKFDPITPAEGLLLGREDVKKKFLKRVV